MTGPEFVKQHGSPLGDDAHVPWSPADWDAWDHLNAADCDEQRLKRAARERQLAAAPDTTGGNR